MNKYKFIAIDIDGTLLNDEKVLLDKTKKDLHLAHEKGTIVCICTGRGYPAARPYIEQIGLNIPLILYNGSRVRMSYDDTILYNQIIEQNVATDVFNLINKYNGTCCFWKEDTLYFNKNDEYAVYYERLTKVKPNFVTEINDELFTNINKFIWFGDSEWLEHVQNVILKGFSGVDYFKSQPKLLEIVPPNVNKGETLKKVCETYNIAQDEVIAIGDEENDISMILYAGLGVAMGNAKKSVKDSANYITLSNNENGVGEVIKKFIL